MPILQTDRPTTLDLKCMPNVTVMTINRLINLSVFLYFCAFLLLYFRQMQHWIKCIHNVNVKTYNRVTRLFALYVELLVHFNA